MCRYRQGTVTVVFLFIFILLPHHTAYAYPPCGPYRQPSAEGFCRSTFEIPGALVRINNRALTAYVRSAAASDAPVVATLTLGTYLHLVGLNSTWDGHQRWWFVQTSNGVQGWLEEAVIEPYLKQLPFACYVNLPKIYLVINEQRRHIADWDTYLNLGYLPYAFVPCGKAAEYPEGAPITRLIKGSSDRVYLMVNGERRHILNMNVFNAHGFKLADISVLPDTVIALWPEGKPIVS